MSNRYKLLKVTKVEQKWFGKRYVTMCTIYDTEKCLCLNLGKGSWDYNRWFEKDSYAFEKCWTEDQHFAEYRLNILNS